MWEIKIHHPGLNKYRVIKGIDKNEVNRRADAQIAIWDEMYRRKLEREQRAFDRRQRAIEKQTMSEEAQSRTQEAKQAIEELENILRHAYDMNNTLIWETLKDTSTFNQPKPNAPHPDKVPPTPNESDQKYQPIIGIFDKMVSSRKEEKKTAAKNLFKSDMDKWREKEADILKANKEYLVNYEKRITEWEVSKKEFLLRQQNTNEAIDKRKTDYYSGNPDSIIDYCELILSNSKYPDYFPKEYDLDYNNVTKILIVEYSLPAFDDIPRIKEVKYVQSKNELVETYLSESILNKLYDSLIYQITLRTIYELYKADVVDALDSIVFNGWVESIDKSTGQQVNACILSIQTNKNEFLSIHLPNVDPKVCFKGLKGVGSSKLHSLTPIAPVLSISREDKRFVSSYEVTSTMNEFSNLAAMDWKDFENLIREIFEKEFAKDGGEVKITQASRDGGVDAVAFDPDPIRGGKIVIQAKRYTNTVGVSAVRDLYGTVLNEGASKGILVTTSDYGPDAYAFAKGKPLTLLSGSHLLHLLEKHGHRAIIDLKAAKKILADKEKEEGK